MVPASKEVDNSLGMLSQVIILQDFMFYRLFNELQILKPSIEITVMVLGCEKISSIQMQLEYYYHKD